MAIFISYDEQGVYLKKNLSLQAVDIVTDVDSSELLQAGQELENTIFYII
jgi:hypothetical protein